MQMKLFHFHRIFKNRGGGGGASEPPNYLWIRHCTTCSFTKNKTIIFRAPDRNVRYFYPCEVILHHTPIPALEKDKKRIAACRPHAGRTSIRDVIVMFRCDLSPCSISGNSGFSGGLFHVFVI